eukprot:TRINITY_DN13836_c0_g1_i1.p2 TRINITY_DN13836_c0_g1~~TRINITY_DN13836_c0_g1_i1.p2  ORF type:complete len:123 (+),score=40.93 TRINITY_DN13836_c0_g1_i1:74-442(+)
MSTKRERGEESEMANSAKKVRKGGLKMKGAALPVKGKKKKEVEQVVLHKEEQQQVVQVEPEHIDRRTDAEIKFERNRRERLQQQATSTAKKSYRENILENNAKLSKLTEHNDIPKVTYRTNK